MMDQIESGESSVKIKCREAATLNMRTMSRLSGVLKGEAGIPFDSILPIAKIITSIVQKDKDSFDHANAELKSFITKRNRELSLQDIRGIAEINFLEGFAFFISYIHTGSNPGNVGADVKTDEESHSYQSFSEDQSLVRTKISPKRRASKRLDETIEEPARKYVRSTKEEVQEVGKNQVVQVKPTRKSTRIDGGQKFDCAFNGCNDVFSTAQELIAHSLECEHKSDCVLVFRCSGCKRAFLTDKAVKSHIGHMRNADCSGSTITIETVKKINNNNEERNRSFERSRDSKDRRMSRHRKTKEHDLSQMIECPIDGCEYSNKGNLEYVYYHIRGAHPDQATKFTCLECGDMKASGKAMTKHIRQVCVNGKVKLEVSNKTDLVVSPADLANEWEITLRNCPIPNCDFTATAARRLSLHFKSDHSGNELLFKCSKCANMYLSAFNVMLHCKKCKGSHPDAIVNESNIVKKSARKRVARHQSLPPPTMVMRKRERLSLNMKRSWNNVEDMKVDVDDMPVLEMIELDDEEGEGEVKNMEDEVKEDMPDKITKEEEQDETEEEILDISDDSSVL